MICIDCHAAGRSSAAAAACSRCGAGVCPEHTVTRLVSMTATPSLGRMETPTRTLTLCRSCDQGYSVTGLLPLSWAARRRRPR